MKTNFKLALLCIVLAGFTASCSSTKQAKIEDENRTASAVAKSHGTYFTVLEFNKGKTELTAHDKKELEQFAKKVDQDGREVSDIKILSWSDREYPVKAEKINKSDVKMANKRADEIEDYFKDVLDVDHSFKTYNMAKRPSKIDELIKTEDYKTKNIFEKTGAMPTSSSNEMARLMSDKASKALIMVEYK